MRGTEASVLRHTGELELEHPRRDGESDVEVERRRDLPLEERLDLIDPRDPVAVRPALDADGDGIGVPGKTDRIPVLAGLARRDLERTDVDAGDGRTVGGLREIAREELGAERARADEVADSNRLLERGAHFDGVTAPLHEERRGDERRDGDDERAAHRFTCKRTVIRSFFRSVGIPASSRPSLSRTMSYWKTSRARRW